MIIVPTPRPIDNVTNVIQREHATLFPGVPAMYIGIVNHPDVASYDLTSVRACLSGAAPLPMEIQERFGALTGGRLVEGYGLTDDAISARVREALRADSSTYAYADRVQIATRAGVVTLHGVVDDLSDNDNLLAVAAYVRGGTAVIDDLRARGL